MSIALTPVGRVPRSSFTPGAQCAVHLDHVLIHPCPPEWCGDDVVVYRADKTPGEPLMTPEAHFYGATAFCVLSHHDTVSGRFRHTRISDCDPIAIVNGRRYTALLCQPSGAPHPKPSADFYPSTLIRCPVSFSTWNAVSPGDSVYLLPTEGSLHTHSVALGPPDTPEPNGVAMRVVDKRRNPGRRPPGQSLSAKYVFVGPTLRRKVIQSPMFRDVGAAVHQSGSPPSDRAMPGTTGNKLVVTTRKEVVVGEDFRVSGRALRVDALLPRGFDAYELIDQRRPFRLSTIDEPSRR